jgi:hypothetical protein
MKPSLAAPGPALPGHPAKQALEPLTENERAWLEFLRLIWGSNAPAPTLRLVQAVHLAFRQPACLPAIFERNAAGPDGTH